MLLEGQGGWLVEILGHLESEDLWEDSVNKRVILEQHLILTLLFQLSLQKMLMKQQERLEEREQDIEDQLYKLESDKRLVEVVNPEHTWGDGGAGS